MLSGPSLISADSGRVRYPDSAPISSPTTRNATRFDRPSMALRRFRCELLALFDRLFDGPDHVKGGFRQIVVFAFAKALEALDGVGEVDQLAGRRSEERRVGKECRSRW